ncbi:bacterio-opsin activator HTH domain-containing protein [Natrialba chahannaoensis JCM 10990]|uniref:Bacterio-opsin activator HTH domain-containing protein n=1 Tax=Natrialba chahannaoensis JCM 10990 TaxID=1227492 RepID=M0AD33_9EURY|nr:helix-turn-helix domain-containing protein [Natrialba chahannaoensis]ELY95258.1 bacterio-opsin activator HTH domain-containing protein [Natrialba chahannaoensis JCM 10990]
MSLDLTDAEPSAETESEPKTTTDSPTSPPEGNRCDGLRSQADGGVVAQLRLEHADLVLRPTLRRALENTVEPEYWTTTDRTVLFVTVYGSEFDGFEGALAEDPTITDPVLVDRYPDRRVYRVTLTERALTFMPIVTETDGRVLEITSTRDGWLVQLRFPDRDSLVSFNDECRTRGMSVAVEHLRVSDDEDDGVVALTEKQQELLLVAYQEGYFDVPRGISQDELADRLGVSKSAVSQRLRRAIGELCGATIA